MTFTATSEIFAKKPAGDIRIESNNLALNQSDLYAIVKQKREAQVIVEDKKEKIRLRKAHRAEIAIQESKIQSYLEISGQVRCKCKSKCTARCPCRKEKQKCILVCGCACEHKKDSVIMNQLEE